MHLTDVLACCFLPAQSCPLHACRLQQLVENGPHPPPGQTGAKYIVREDGQRLDLRFLKKDSDRHLEMGYKVERHLVDGDYVLFNRQPSLHKMSMMVGGPASAPWMTTAAQFAPETVLCQWSVLWRVDCNIPMGVNHRPCITSFSTLLRRLITRSMDGVFGSMH